MTLYKTKRNCVQFALKIHPRIPGAILGKLHKLTALKRQDAHYLSDFRQTYNTVLFFVDRVSVLLEHVHRISKAYVRFTPDFLSFFFDLLSFWQAPQPLQHSVHRLNRSQVNFEIRCREKASPGNSLSVMFVSRTNVFANTVLAHYSRVSQLLS